MLKRLALVLIRGYQKFLSPYKGFSCALRVRTGGHSCSRFGYNAIDRHGFFLGMTLLRRRLAKCSWHAHQHNQSCTKPDVPQYAPRSRPGMVFSNGKLVNQGGFADCDCSGCDAPSCDLPSCDMPSCDMPSCDMPDCGSHPSSKLLSCSGDVCEGAAWGCGDTRSSSGSSNCGPRNCCGSSAGHVREQSRLDEIRKRREGDDGDDGDDGDAGDGGDGGD